jgi:integrase
VPFDEFDDGHLAHVLTQHPAKSRHLVKAAWSSWFKWGVQTRRLDRNPVDFLPAIRYKPPRDYDVFRDAEVAALCAVTPLATLMFWSGMRLAELRSFTAKRIDFDGRQLLVIDGAKRESHRRVPMVAALHTAMDEYVTLEGLNSDDHLWSTRPGVSRAQAYGRVVRDHPIGDSTFYRWWQETLGAAGVRYRRPHLARHTFATRLKTLGLPVEEIKQLLGHESIRTTIDTYVHQDVEEIAGHLRELVGDRI